MNKSIGIALIIIGVFLMFSNLLAAFLVLIGIFFWRKSVSEVIKSPLLWFIITISWPFWEEAFVDYFPSNLKATLFAFALLLFFIFNTIIFSIMRIFSKKKEKSNSIVPIKSSKTFITLGITFTTSIIITSCLFLLTVVLYIISFVKQGPF